MAQRLIKTKADYESALARLGVLMDSSPGTSEFDELEVLSALLEIYENEHHPINTPNPIEAIKFRMEQSNLQPKHLVPLLGSRAKVSEVLSGKRALTLSMIRVLHEKLKIPAEILLQEPNVEMPESPVESPEKLPWKQILERNWLAPVFRGTVEEAQDKAIELSRHLFRNVKNVDFKHRAFMYRRSVRITNFDKYSLMAWTCQIVNRAQDTIRPTAYRKSSIDESFMRNLITLSYLDDGPRLAKEYLAKHGILLVIEEHLKKTHVDGAAVQLKDGTPVIGMSLRHDRLDNFWFSLCHELAHVKLHLESNADAFYIDDLDVTDVSKEEKDADNWAQDMLIPPQAWNEIAHAHSQYEIEGYARDLRISPAIIAGRLRRDSGNYKLYSGLVGHGEVRKHFVNT